jgi:hypothetical protein
MFTIPEDATPADLIGETDILPGQDWLDKAVLEEYTNRMIAGTFPWKAANAEEPMEFQVAANATVIYQGHHSWVAARVPGIEIPVTILISRDYWPGAIPFAYSWQDVKWETLER